MNIAGKYRNKNAVSISARRISRYYTPTISRYHVIFLLMLAFCFNSGMSQGIVDKSADNGFMVRQIPNSESALKSFFSRLPTDSDTIYATIFRPANCPRCDGFLNNAYRLLKQETDKPYVLIAVYPDSIAAQSYIDKNEIKSDHIIFDLNEDFSKFLSFSPGYLHVGYILKLNKKTGELIVGSNIDNASTPFFKELNAYSIRKDPVDFSSIQGNPYDWDSPDSGKMALAAKYNIVMPDSTYTISEILYQPVFHKDRLIWNDKLALAVAEFGLDGSDFTLRRLVEPDSTESRRFANIPSSDYDKMVKSGQLKNMPLQPFIIDDDKYGVAYSLPDLWLDEKDGLCYRNKPCFIKKSFSDTEYSELIPLEYDFEDIFYYPHFNMKWAGDGDVVVGVQRITWPMITDKNEYMDSPENNPFLDSFYDSYQQPVLATYSSDTGLLTRRFGNLPDFAKKAKTGYSFSDMVFDSSEGEAVYASSYDGNIVVTSLESLDCPDCRRHYKAFSVDESVLTVPDTTDYYSYRCNLLAEPFLNRKIVDIKADDHNIHCILRHCTDAFERPELEEYDYILINRDSGERATFEFPDKATDERRIAYGLRRRPDMSVAPFLISNADGHWTVSEFSINQP